MCPFGLSNVHIGGSRRFKHHQNSTRRHPERQKERKWRREREKSAKFWALHPSGHHHDTHQIQKWIGPKWIGQNWIGQNRIFQSRSFHMHTVPAVLNRLTAFAPSRSGLHVYARHSHTWRLVAHDCRRLPIIKVASRRNDHKLSTKMTYLSYSKKLKIPLWSQGAHNYSNSTALRDITKHNSTRALNGSSESAG